MGEERRVVLLTARADLRTAVLRLAAVAGVAAEVVSASAIVQGVWRAAPVVVVGSDLAPVVAAAGLPRRGGVVVVTTIEPDAETWRATVDLGATRLLRLPIDDGDLVDLMSDAVEAVPSGGATIAVVGGCGGAGASTLAAALAVLSARDSPTLLVDGDRLGGGIDVLLGAEQRAGARWPDLAGTRGRLGSGALTEALVRVDALAVLSWDRTGSADLDADAAAAVMNAAGRGFAVVIVDLPRCIGPATAVLAAAADLVVLVVPATVRATAAAAMVAAQVLGHCPQVGLVVCDAGGGRLAAREVAEALGLPVLATLQREAAVANAADRGEPPLRRRGSLAEVAGRVLASARSQAAA